MALYFCCNGAFAGVNGLWLSAKWCNLVEEIYPRNRSLAAPIKPLKDLIELSLIACSLICQIVPHILKRNGFCSLRDEIEE